VREGLVRRTRYAMLDLPAIMFAVALERGPNAKSWSMQQYQGGKMPRPNSPHQRPRRIVRRGAEADTISSRDGGWA